MQEAIDTAVVAEAAGQATVQVVFAVPRAPVKTEKEIMVELATDAMEVSSEQQLGRRVAGDKQKLDLLDALQKRKNVSSKISPVADRLLSLVHTKGHPFYERRRVVFLLLTKYNRNWWHKSDTSKEARASHAQEAGITQACSAATRH